jgi:hypothetical protein
MTAAGCLAPRSTGPAATTQTGASRIHEAGQPRVRERREAADLPEDAESPCEPI